jgi:anti-sigma regulatory factor (Ser/Thr protein kinase)
VTAPSSGARRMLADFSLPSEPGNERRAMEEVAKAVSGLGLPENTLERLKTAVAEATMNAMEHGNHYRAELAVLIEVSASEAEISVKVTDEGSGPPAFHSETPDLEAKLEGMQTPRGWGLFLIQNMVDEMRVTGDEAHHTVELILHLDGHAEGGK